jgi:hypothetical protein
MTRVRHVCAPSDVGCSRLCSEPSPNCLGRSQAPLPRSAGRGGAVLLGRKPRPARPGHMLYEAEEHAERPWSRSSAPHRRSVSAEPSAMSGTRYRARRLRWAPRARRPVSRRLSIGGRAPSLVARRWKSGYGWFAFAERRVSLTASCRGRALRLANGRARDRTRVRPLSTEWSRSAAPTRAPPVRPDRPDVIPEEPHTIRRSAARKPLTIVPPPAGGAHAGPR